MVRGNGALDAWRRRTYTAVLTAGVVGASCALLVNEVTGVRDPATRGILALAIVFLVLQVLLLRSKRFGVPVVERTLHLGMGALVLSTIAYSLYLRPALDSVFGLYSWLPAIYALSFLMYESRVALRRSALLYALVVCVSLPDVFLASGADVPYAGFGTLSQVYLANAATIAVLFFFTRLRGQLARAQAVAERMTHLARTDVLTGIPNRRGIQEALENEMARSMRYGQPLSVILFDLDDFKQLNDDFGHDAGDRVLASLSRMVGSHLRTADSLGRWGGEEFVIVAPETSAEAAGLLADRVRAAIANHVVADTRRVSASFGIAAHGPGESAEALIKRADTALYRAKAQGKNRVEPENAA